jgi:DNA repair exonuclease SbcCD ATPase subunit
MNLSPIQHAINMHKLDYSSAKIQLADEKKKLKEAQAYLKAVEEARKICQDVAQTIQRQAHHQIEKIVSLCLQTIFGDDYSFEILFVKKRGRTEAQLNLKYKNNVIENPLEGSSGGVLDVAGFALRLSCLMLSKPQCRKLLVLDEPFKNLHGLEYRERVRVLLEKLSKDFQVQLVIVTGIPDFEIGKVLSL